jgi:uncharacterized paraquat-inducible protein A
MPDIHFECPKCKQTLDAPDELAGQLIECPTCKETIEVPVRSRQVKLPTGFTVREMSPSSTTASLSKCPSCRADVSTEAASCPKCGHLFKYAGGINLQDPVHVIGLIICALIVIGVVWYLFAILFLYR